MLEASRRENAGSTAFFAGHRCLSTTSRWNNFWLGGCTRVLAGHIPHWGCSAVMHCCRDGSSKGKTPRAHADSLKAPPDFAGGAFWGLSGRSGRECVWHCRASGLGWQIPHICREPACCTVRCHDRAAQNRHRTSRHGSIGPRDVGAEFAVQRERLLGHANVGRRAANQEFIRVGEIRSAPSQCATEFAWVRSNGLDQTVATDSLRIGHMEPRASFGSPSSFRLFIIISGRLDHLALAAGAPPAIDEVLGVTQPG